MPRKKLTMGIDAVVSVLSRVIHPSAHIRDKYVNPVKGHRLEGCIVIRQEMKKIRRQDVQAVVFRHDDFVANGNPIELYAHPRYIKITTEGPPEGFYEEAVEATEHEEPAETDDGIPIDSGIFRSTADDVDLVRNQGLSVDDDNEPAPENIPTSDPTNNIFSSWNTFNNVCPRRSGGIHNTSAWLTKLPRDMVPTKLQLFERLFPKQYVLDVIIPGIRTLLPNITYGCWLQFLGIWFTMASVQGYVRHDFWSTAPLTGMPDAAGAPY